MQPWPAENQPASTSTGELYFFTFWPYEDRAFLRALYKKFACTKVHLMAPIMESAPPDRWDCGHWNMWRNMARAVRSQLRGQVSPKKMESFFWQVIAQGTDANEVTERLDKLIYGPYEACSAGHTSSGALVGKVRATESETTSSEEYDESIEDDDDSDFTLRPSKSARKESKDTGRAAKRARSSSSEDQRLPSQRAASSESVKVRRISSVSDSDVALLPVLLPFEVCNMSNTFVRQQAFEQDARSGSAGEPLKYDATGAPGQRIAHSSVEPCTAGDEATLVLVPYRPPSLCASSSGTADTATADSGSPPHASGEAKLDNDDLSPPCAAEKSLLSVSTVPCLDDDPPRCDVAGGNMSHGSTNQPPDAQVYYDKANAVPDAEVDRDTADPAPKLIPETASSSPVAEVNREVINGASVALVNYEVANHVDQGVQYAPTCANKAVQCNVDSSRVADMMQREHLLRMEVMELHMKVVMKKLRPSPP